MKICKIDGCNNKIYAKVYCSKHYQQFNKKDKEDKCKIEGCHNLVHSKGYCQNHYMTIRYKEILKNKTLGINNEKPCICTIEHCYDKVYAKGVCKAHYYQQYYNNTKKTSKDFRVRRNTKCYSDKISNKEICKVEKCRYPVFKNGYCKKHYIVVKKYGEINL